VEKKYALRSRGRFFFTNPKGLALAEKGLFRPLLRFRLGEDFG